jgi:polyisoprenoid-binding protein YceI
MKMLRTLSAASALALVVAATPALAAVETLNIDASHSNVGFSIRHFFTPVKGEFKEVKGTIALDAANPNNSKVEVAIPAASINTNHEKRDGHLRTADFFDVENHPTITFVSKTIAVDPKTNKGTMTGDLTMRGVTKPLTLNVEMLGMMKAGTGQVAGFTATGTLNRKDFGINWNRALDQGGAMLADDVNLIIDVEAKTPPPAKPAENAAAAETKK